MEFDPTTQIFYANINADNSTLKQNILSIGNNIVSWSTRGCKTSNPVVSLPVDNPVPGGLYYKEGNLVTITLNNTTRLYGPKYFVTDFPQLKKDNSSTKKDMYCTNAGTLGDIEPTHTEGVVTNGTCELLWVSPIARYEMRNK